MLNDKGKKIRQQLRDWAMQLRLFKDVRGMGLMIGAELTDNYTGKAGDIGEIAREYGVLILQAGPNVLRLLPPLIINDDDLDEAMTRLYKALKHFVSL